jgi:alpha-glucosidase (family GH31 glycosyl hydrolase)
MVGSALKVSPIFAPMADAKTYTSYFPKGQWVSMTDFNAIIDNSEGGQNVELTAQDTVQVHLRQGSIIAHQDNSDFMIKTTTDLL